MNAYVCKGMKFVAIIYTNIFSILKIIILSSYCGS